MTSSTKPKKYPTKIVEQAEHQLAGNTDVETLLDLVDKPTALHSFRNLEIYFKDREKFTISDLHLLLETLTHEMPAAKDYGREIRMNFSVSGVLSTLMSNLRFPHDVEARICKEFLRGMHCLEGFQTRMKELTCNFLDDHPNTELHYMYRCACNYKTHEEIVVNGHLALADIMDKLEDYNKFIAHQVGLSAPQDDLSMNLEYDHVWCELVGIEYTQTTAERGNTAAKLVKSFKKARWDVEEAVQRYGL